MNYIVLCSRDYVKNTARAAEPNPLLLGEECERMRLDDELAGLHDL